MESVWLSTQHCVYLQLHVNMTAVNKLINTPTKEVNLQHDDLTKSLCLCFREKLGCKVLIKTARNESSPKVRILPSPWKLSNRHSFRPTALMFTVPSGVGSQCSGKLGNQSKGLRLPQLQPQTRLPQPLCRRLGLPDVAGGESIISCSRILPGVPLTKWHSPGRNCCCFSISI